jgi:membrane fusion protein, heavy metal efflux system
METKYANETRRIARSPGIAWLLAALAAGIFLGAWLYPKFVGKTLLSSFSNEKASEPGKSADAHKAPNVVQVTRESQMEVGISVEPAAVHSLHVALSATGIVSEDPGRVAHVRSLARGLIEKVYARLGDRVLAGGPLVEYDNIELGIAIGEYLSANTELQRGLTDLAVREKILERSRQMLQAGAVAQTTHDLREAEVQDAEAKVAGARATVAKIAEQIRRFGLSDKALEELSANPGSARHTLSHSILRTPFAGVVTNHHAVESEVVEQGTELMTITDMSWLWVLADVYEKDLSQIRTGQTVRVRVASYPDQFLTGKITHIADIMDPKTRTAKVRCLVSNESRLLKLEMFATIEIPVQHTNPVLAVPSSSIQQIEGQSVVFIRNSETEFEMRKVQTGVESQGFTEIRSGLNKGDAVVNRGSFILKAAFLKHLIGEEEG